ncbi:COP9 signalosome complex subunit 7b [Holothuria leucospilota]|uniref:COP9 signalosome complex subunit 7b n=1 Tax=Holothuria leucospilota TaxID=206669 RepID=A0A9Q0YFC1_HOLLE|nr:COP9 signalosome complex subunit 7b [Holothuria leucospilota]
MLVRIRSLIFYKMSEAGKTSNALEQYVLLAKGTKGAAAVALIRQVLEAPGVYVFGELLEVPNIQEVKIA